MNEVISTDGERVSVAGDQPYGEVLTHDAQARCDGRRSTVNRMESVGVHVVGESRRASDARHKDDLFFRDAQLGHDLLHGREDGIVAATRAPSYFLIRGKILFC